MKPKDPWYKSKRIYAAGVLIVATVLAGFGIEVDAETQELMIDNLTAVGAGVAALVSAGLDIWSKIDEKNK